MSPSQKFGLSCEYSCVDWLQSIGYHCQLTSDFFSRYDFLLEGIPVHVVSARRRSHFTGSVWRSRWYFTFSRIDFFYPSLVIACAFPSYTNNIFVPFLIPSWLVKSKSLSITSDPVSYSGWASPYRRFLSSIEQVRRVIMSSYQLPLFP